jgi:hypothetical protein
MTWIDVKDRLPEKSNYYLVVDVDVFNVNLDGINNSRFVDYAYFNGGVFYEPDSDGDRFLGVTHWMELPELPKLNK